MMVFSNMVEKNDVLIFVDLLKRMLLVDNNGQIIPLRVLEHPFFSAVQHNDSSQNKNIKNLMADMKEDEPAVLIGEECPQF